MSGLLLVVLLIPYIALSYFENTSAYMMSYTTAWYFFVLLNAFYGGALTMFFTSKVSIPFDTVRDVMRAYPSWRLIVQDGKFILLSNNPKHLKKTINAIFNFRQSGELPVPGCSR